MWKKVLVTLFASSVVMMSMNQSAFAMRQPAMERSLQILQNAERALMKATPNKGGHRAKALRHIQKAMQEVRNGIEFANRRQEGGHYKQRMNIDNARERELESARDRRNDNLRDRKIEKEKAIRMERRSKEYTDKEDKEKELQYLERRYER
ncbi:MAG: hypothetical protein OEY29_07485 [Gammaproteobacteria bacterium]|nr:hypothetical protein [Gammaproteobacteria bacterium]